MLTTLFPLGFLTATLVACYYHSELSGKNDTRAKWTRKLALTCAIFVVLLETMNVLFDGLLFDGAVTESYHAVKSLNYFSATVMIVWNVVMGAVVFWQASSVVHEMEDGASMVNERQGTLKSFKFKVAKRISYLLRTSTVCTLIASVAGVLLATPVGRSPLGWSIVWFVLNTSVITCALCKVLSFAPPKRQSNSVSSRDSLTRRNNRTSVISNKSGEAGVMSRWCYTVVKLLLHCCHIVLTLLLLLLHCCYTVVKLLLHCCYT
jgi:hypothetical protein